MKRMAWLICLIGWFMSTSNITAQPALTAYFEVKNTRPRIGEPIEAVLVIEYSDQIEVLQRPILPKEWGIFSVIDIQERQITTANGRILERQSFTVVAWQTGDHALPKSEILYRVIGTADLQTYTLPDVFLSIPSVLLEDSLTLRPDEAPITIPFLPIWAFFTAISLVLGILIGIYQLWRYYARQNTHQAEAPNPQDIFLEELKSLQTATTNTMRYTLLSHILRNYLRARYGILAHEMTDQELLYALKTDGRVTSYQLTSLAEILEHLAMGRFSTLAVSHPPEHLIRMAEAWVQNVSPEVLS
jgi:hypothetical protein